MPYTNRVATDGQPMPEVDAGQAVQSGDLLAAIDRLQAQFAGYALRMAPADSGNDCILGTIAEIRHIAASAPAEARRSHSLQPDVGHPVGCECNQCYAEARVLDVDTLPVCECEQLDGGLTMGIGDVPHHPKCPMSNAPAEARSARRLGPDVGQGGHP